MLQAVRGRSYVFNVFSMSTNEKKKHKKHKNSDFLTTKHYQINCGIKIKPLLHCCFSILGDIALPTGRAISPSIEKQQCNNVLVYLVRTTTWTCMHGHLTV